LHWLQVIVPATVALPVPADTLLGKCAHVISPSA
jgi:hypothetical protein